MPPKTDKAPHRSEMRRWARSGNDARSPILPYRTVDESRSEHNGSALPQTPLSELTKKVVSDVGARAVRSSFVKRKWRSRMVRIGAQAILMNLGRRFCSGQARFWNEPVSGRLRRPYGVRAEPHALPPLHQGGPGAGGQCVRQRNAIVRASGIP